MKKIILILILAIVLSGCGANKIGHRCKIEAVNECGKNNVKWSDGTFGCDFICKDYSKYIKN